MQVPIVVTGSVINKDEPHRSKSNIAVNSPIGILISAFASAQCFQFPYREARWPSGRVSDSVARDRGSDPHSGRRVVSLSKIHLPPQKYW